MAQIFNAEKVCWAGVVCKERNVLRVYDYVWKQLA